MTEKDVGQRYLDKMREPIVLTPEDEEKILALLTCPNCGEKTHSGFCAGLDTESRPC